MGIAPRLDRLADPEDLPLSALPSRSAAPLRRRRLAPPTPVWALALLAGSTWLVGCQPSTANDSSEASATVPEPASALRPADVRGEVPPEARIADYEIEARLDTQAHRVSGHARVTWRNTTSRTVDTVPFHLYLNGFRAEDTAWMQGSEGRHRGNRQAVDDESPWGYIDVTAVDLLGLADAASEVGPSRTPLAWREHEEPSTMTVDLPSPVGPGEQITLSLAFDSQLPRVFARTGHADEFHSVAQWYPKIGVLEEDQGWQAHTFTLHDEFYADFGNYRVTLDVPAELKVGATGIRVEDTPLDDDRRRLVYEAEMVHDFVWMGDPRFVEHSGRYEDVRVRQLIMPELLDTADDHLEAIRFALASYEDRFGPYPWSTITVVHPPEGAEGAGGMEYPTLFTSSDQVQFPAWVREHLFDERMTGVYVTVHELGHQYFQGLFASREHLEPWLDEGLNTFANFLAYQDAFEDPWIVDIRGNRLYMTDVLHLVMGDGAAAVPIARRASDFETAPGSFGTIVYQKTSAAMITLRNLVGHERFDRAFRAYTDFARFAHPRRGDLERILIEELGERPNVAPAGHEPVELDLRAFFEQALDGVGRVDFSIRRVRNTRLLGTAGWQRDADGQLVGGEPPTSEKVADLDDAQVHAKATLLRQGAFVVPVEVLATFADGSEELTVWDGREASLTLDWPGKRLESVHLDPRGKLQMESRTLDNYALVPTARDDDESSRPVRTLVEAIGLALVGGLLP